MPTNHRIDDFDLDVAQLGDPLTDDALDLLSSVCEARDAARELLKRLQIMQDELEAGRAAYATREKHVIDLEELTATIAVKTSGII